MVTHGNGTGYGYKDYIHDKTLGILGDMPKKPEKQKRHKKK